MKNEFLGMMKFNSIILAINYARKEFRVNSYLPKQLNIQKFIYNKFIVSWRAEFIGNAIFQGNRFPVFCRYEDAISIYRGGMPNFETEDGFFSSELEWESHCIEMYDNCHKAIIL